MTLTRLIVAWFIPCLLFIPPAYSSEEKAAFIDANVLSIFYHELGHAVIDLLQIPIYGQEEDAADVMAVMLIDRLFEEEAAQAIAYDSAFGFINDPEQQEDVPYWDLHGPDEQRYYNHVCLFYGADPTLRAELAADLGLPDERAETCPEEFDQANASWSLVFDKLLGQGPGESLIVDSLVVSTELASGIAPLAKILESEITRMNQEFALPREVTVVVDECGESNAFYDPEAVSITFCAEFVDHLSTLFDTYQ